MFHIKDAGLPRHGSDGLDETPMPFREAIQFVRKLDGSVNSLPHDSPTSGRVESVGGHAKA
jgi:hypothetical protein